MKKLMVGGSVLVVALTVALVVVPASQAGDDDMALVRKQCQAFVAAWNEHDPVGMANIFAENGDMIGPDGTKAAGRAAIQAAWTEKHGEDGDMAESTLKILDEPVRFVTPEVALSDATVKISGMLSEDGEPMDAMLHVTQVWKKTSGQWLVFASRPCIKSMGPPELSGPGGDK